MSKKLWICSIGCLIIGLAIGYFCGLAGIKRRALDVNAACNMGVVTTALREANEAYHHETHPVAIYALTRALDQMNLCDQHPEHYAISGEPFFMSRQQFAFYMMMTHARLAEIYGETGQTNLSQQHIPDMLGYAKDGTNYPSIAKEPALLKFVHNQEKGAK
jgi:hypothetical protein